jgi:hypothetical protein
MSDWQIFVATGIASIGVGLIYKIFLEVRSIRRMMNADRNIPRD